MKVKVKGLVFAGAAAAIFLSAGAANAAKTAHTVTNADAGVVTSKKFTETTYEHWADKTEAQGTQAGLGTLVNGENADNLYPSLSAMKQYTNNGNAGQLATMGTNGLYGTNIVTAGELESALGTDSSYSGSDTAVPSEAALVAAMDAISDLDAAAMKNSTADWQVGNDQGEWSTVVNGDYTTISQVSAGDSSTPETVKLDITPTKITQYGVHDTAVDIEDLTSSTSTNAGNLATAWAVKDYSDTTKQPKQTTANYKVGKNGDWQNVDSAVGATTGGYLAKDSTRTDGGVNLGIDSTKITKVGVSSDSSVVDIADVQDGTGTGANLATAWAVKGYADSKVTQTIRDNYTTYAPSEDAVHAALALEQDIQIGAAKQTNPESGQLENSTDAGKILVVDNDGKISMGENISTVTPVDSITDNDMHAVTSNAVYDKLTAMFGAVNVTFEGNCNPSGAQVANQNINCALVMKRASNGTITLTWREMAGGAEPANG